MSDDFIDLKKKTEALQNFSAPWFICGGWAIDLALGYKTREHKDIDIGIFRDNQSQLQKHFSNWILEKVNPEDESVSEWISHEFLKLHQIKLELASETPVNKRASRLGVFVPYIGSNLLLWYSYNLKFGFEFFTFLNLNKVM